MSEAITQQMKLIEDDSRESATVAASSIAASAQETLKEGRELLQQKRLYVPGILYHVIRSPLEPGENVPDGVPVKVDFSKEAEQDSFYKYMIIRGDDPSSRFQKIVLSGSLISDHLCAGLEEGIASATKWQHARTDLLQQKALAL
jgi:hypothetical protein